MQKGSRIGPVVQAARSCIHNARIRPTFFDAANTPLALPITFASRRCISIEHRRRLASPYTPFEGHGGNKEAKCLYHDELRQDRPHLRIKIPKETKDPEAWLDAIEPLLPRALRHEPLDDIEAGTYSSSLSENASYWLCEAQRVAGLDLLSYLGIVKQRWDIVSWAITTISNGRHTFDVTPEDIRTSFERCWPRVPLHIMTDTPVAMPTAPSNPLGTEFNLDHNLAFESNSAYLVREIQTKGIGQIWRSLGHLILKAATSSANTSSSIMPHVLSALATLHHNDIVPESVYSDSPTQDASAIQQPPILHLLSSRILGALSDAAWNAHQASTASSKAEPKSKYSILYSELPGTRYKTQAQDLRPEIWLEFVLWSCLHGDWVSDGAAILQSMQEYTDESSWSLISWRQIMENANTVEKGEGTGTQSREHLENGTVYRTVSSELVSAYVDGLINLIDVGVSDQGMPLNVILSRVKGLKALLDQKNFGLGNTTWDATVQRFTESGGIVVENDPESMLEILALVQPYEVERECLNVPTDDLSTHPTPSYTFDSSALCLGLYHRVIQSYIDIGNVDEALATWETLQRFTDLNQQRSIEQFFRHGAQNTAENSTDIMFVSPTGFRNTEYPSFFPRVPYHILTPLINLLTDSRISSFQKWLIHSSDLDGPTISRSVYSEASLAPALIRFAATFGDKELLEEIIKAQSDVMGTEGFRLPRSVLSALIQSQIRRHRWAHVHRLLLTTGEKYDNAVWHPPIVAGLAREIMLLQRNVKAGRTRKENESLAQATEIFQLLYEDTYGPSIKHWGKFEALRVLHSIIGVLSSVNTEWANLCNGLSILSGNQSLSLHIRIFDTILEGVVESLGVEAGRRLWETWCVDLAEEGIRHSGGIAKVPSEFVSRSSDYFDTNKRIVLDDLPGESLSFYGRLKPTFSTLRIIMRQLQLQKNKSGKNDGRATSTKGTMANQPYEDMMKWALAKYQDLGLDEEKVSKEMLRVENWAKLQERLSIEDSVP